MSRLALADLVDESTFPPANDSTVAELQNDYTGQRITGARVVLEWIARAWLTPRGVLSQARGRGIDLRALENATLGPTEIQRWRQALIAEAELIEYVPRGGVSVRITRGADRVVVVEARVRLIDGMSYPLAVKIGEAGKALVAFGAAA